MKKIEKENSSRHLLRWGLGGCILLSFPLIVCFFANEWGLFDKYEWVITALSLEVAFGSFIVNLLYHKSKVFYLFINQLISFFTRSHTYWHPSFRFTLEENLQPFDHNTFLSELLIDIQKENVFSQVIKRVNLLNPAKAEIEFVKDEHFIFQYDGVSLFVSTDRLLTVPMRLYEQKSRFLSLIAEKIKEHTRALSVLSEIEIQFENKENPYYGFFVNSLPTDFLESFDVSFRTDKESECEVVANIDGVVVKGKSLLETFSTLKNVLLLKPLTISNHEIISVL